ncbi:hypothetical protein Dimus_001688, partial [Dionaea muscipula]
MKQGRAQGSAELKANAEFKPLSSSRPSPSSRSSGQRWAEAMSTTRPNELDFSSRPTGHDDHGSPWSASTSSAPSSAHHRAQHPATPRPVRDRPSL